MHGQDATDARTDPVVVKLPAEIDKVCAEQVGEELAAAFSPGARAVLADLTQTTFCDSAGVRVLVVAYNQAAENGTKLALVGPGRFVRRILQLTGVDSLVPVYASLDAALADLQAG